MPELELSKKVEVFRKRLPTGHVAVSCLSSLELRHCLLLLLGMSNPFSTIPFHPPTLYLALSCDPR